MSENGLERKKIITKIYYWLLKNVNTRICQSMKQYLEGVSWVEYHVSWIEISS